MTDKEKIIELLDDMMGIVLASKSYGAIADHLIENGVKIPVCCKDCKFAELDCDGWYLCHYNGSDWNQGEHFCSYGERG